MKRKLLLMLLAVFLIPWIGNAQVQVGTGTATGQGLPIEPYFGYTYSQVIYLASEINASGTITELQWYFAGSSLSNSNDWTIYIGHTSKTEFSSTTDWVAVGDMTPVYTGTFPDPGAAGWITFDITDWAYNGTDNIVIAVDENASSFNGSSDDFYSTSVSNNRGIMYRNDSNNPDPASPPPASYLRSYIANIIFGGISQACPNPTNQVETNITTSGADLGWTDASGSHWDLYIVPTGDPAPVQGTTPTANDVTANPYTWAGGTANTTYDWYVRSDCDQDNIGTSAWVGPSTFTTACTTFGVPFSEDFTSTTTPNCWSNDSTELWRFSTGAGYGASSAGDHTPGGGTNYAWIDGSSGVGANALITPNINASSLTSPLFEFYYFSNNTDNPGDNNTLYVDFWDGATWNNLLTYSGDNPDWILGSYDLSTYTITGDVKFRFYIGGTATTTYYNDILIDDVSLKELPSCLAPSAQTVATITTSGADLGWTDASGSHWDLYIVPNGDPAPTQGTTPTADDVTANPYTWSGGTANTTYDWYVRSDCDQDNTGTSAWVGPSTFTTLCNTKVAPYTEDFENGGVIPNCWLQGTSNAEDWKFSNTGSGNHLGNNGTMGGATSSGGYFAWVDDSSPHSTGTTLESPMIDVSGLTTPELSFFLISDNEGHTNVDFSVDVWDGAAWNVGFYTHNTNTLNGEWEEIHVNLSTLTITGDMQFRFIINENNGTDFYDDVAIDDVTIGEAPACPAPTAQTVAAITTSGADLGWTDASGSHWDLYIVPTGDPAPVQGTTPTANDVTANPYTWAGGTANTTYDWYVRSDCGQDNTNTSTWTGSNTFTTSPGPHSFPLTEDFESGFTYFDNAYGNTVDFADETTLYHGGSHSVHNSYTASNVNILHETGVLDLSGTTSAILEFWQIAKTEGGYDKCYVEISTDGGNTYTALPDSTYNGSGSGYGTAGYFDEDDYTVWGTSDVTPDNTWWMKETFDLSPYNTTNVRFRFRLTSDGSAQRNGWYIDDIHIYEPSCPAPTAQIETNISGFQADLGWTTGGSTEWQIEWDTAGFTQGTGNLVITSDNPYTLTGLSPTTDYDWYVRDICGAGDSSVWTGPSTFTTTVACPAPTDQVETDVTTTSAKLGWTEVGTASEWEIMIDTANFDTTGYAHTLVTTNPYLKTGLTESTVYDWYVRAKCGGGDYSDWTGPHTFNTICPAVAVPYFQDFDDVTAPAFPFCMTVENTNGDTKEWITTTGGLSAPNSAVIYWNASLAMDDWFFTKGLQLSGGTTYEVSFAYAASSTFPENLAVDWGNSPVSDSMSGTPIFDAVGFYNGWYVGNGTFTPSTTGIYYVGFHGHSDANQYYLKVDDIKVIEEVVATTWNGSAGSDWDDINNWTGGLPSSSTDVTVPTGLTNYPTVTSATTIGHITIESDATGDASLLNDAFLILDSATIQRYVTRGKWHDFSASAQNQTLQSVYFGGNPEVWLRHYNEPDNSRTYLTNLADTMNSGEGFEIWIDAAAASDVTINFVGNLQRGNVALTTASTPALSFSGADPLGYNLVGNPFASPIALDSGAWNMANVDSTFWVWDPSGSGSYKDYNTLTKVGSLTGGIIPMGQGFFIHANAASPTFTIPMAARVHASQAYYKSTRSNDLTKMSLRAYYDTDYYDELNIAFIAGAKELFEGYDTRKMFSMSSTTPQVYAIIPDEQLSLNSLPELNPGDERVIEVGYKVGKDGNQTLVADVSGLEDTEVLLEDLLLNEFQSLNSNPVYTFKGSVGDEPYRFRLHLNRSVTGIDNNVATDVRAYAFHKNLYIASKGDLVNETKHLTVVDMMGRTILDKTIPPGELVRVPMNLSNAYVVVRVISNDKVYTTKVFIN